MDRMACINLPVFTMQLLLRRYPDWKNQPVAVVDADKPSNGLHRRGDDPEEVRSVEDESRGCGLGGGIDKPSLCSALHPPVFACASIRAAVARCGVPEQL